MTKQTMNRYDKARLGAWVGIGGNFFLSAIKLTFGILGRSSALVADAIHTLTDVATSVIVLFGVNIAGKPKDEKHPYGHGRAESMAAQVIAILLIVSAVILGWRSLKVLLAGGPRQVPAAITFWIILLSVVVKEGMYQYKIRLGKKIGSLSVIADAWHHRSDALSSGVAMVGVGGAILGGPKWSFLDPLAACGIFVMIIFVGVGIFRKTVSELMDESPSPDIVSSIKKIAGMVKDVLGIEVVRVRKSGLDLFIEIHIEVDPQMSVSESHEVATRVKKEIIDGIEEVKYVLVHIEPFYPDDH